MKRSFRLLIAIALSFFSIKAVAHVDRAQRVSLQPEVLGKLEASEKIQFGFQLFDAAAMKLIGDQDLQDSHTKKIHLIIYDASLNEFNHVHPTYNGQVWNAELNLLVNGLYYAWAQGTLSDGTEFSALYRTEVIGGKPALVVKPLGDARRGSVEHTLVELSKQKITAGKMTMINYNVTRDDGTQPQITPYLGANAHIIIVSPDGDKIIHAHPMSGNNPNTGMIHTTFPTDGDYRIWVQLIDNGVLKTVPLSVNVQK